MDTSAYLSMAAVAVSLVGLLLSTRKTTREDAAGTARVEAKLDGIQGGVEDIRVETRSMRSRIDSLAERISFVEASCKSAHHRLDTMQKTHPPD